MRTKVLLQAVRAKTEQASLAGLTEDTLTKYRQKAKAEQGVGAEASTVATQGAAARSARL